ncbi:MAG: hypothetical protein IKG88_04000 [Bacteroidales bacterium]|nr:hypothetical protein [Bacteroidales bacterium]
MKRFIILIFSMLIYSVPSVAQVREFQIGAQSNSIIRSVDDEHQLIYTEISSSEAYFILYRNGFSSAKAFKLPKGWQIHDVRIWNDAEAYFCGTVNGSSYDGLVGMFDIYSTFYGSGGVNYTFIAGPAPPLFYVKVHDLKRLDLFISSGQSGDTVNMAMVGLSTFFDPGTTMGTCIASAWFGGASWYLNIFYNKGYEFIYTDIACLDDVVVAAATDPVGQGCYVRSYHAISDFLDHQCMPSTLYGIDFQSPVGDVLISHIKDNRAAVVHYDDTPGIGVSTVLHEVKIDPSTGQPQAAIPTWITTPASSIPFSSSWNLLELDVDKNESPYLLQYADHPTSALTGIQDWMLKFRLQYSSYTAQAWHPNLCKSQSLDLEKRNFLPVLSGNGTYLDVYEALWNSLTPPCAIYSPIMTNYTTALRAIAYTDASYERRSCPNNMLLPTLIQVAVEKICP